MFLKNKLISKYTRRINIAYRENKLLSIVRYIKYVIFCEKKVTVNLIYIILELKPIVVGIQWALVRTY